MKRICLIANCKKKSNNNLGRKLLTEKTDILMCFFSVEKNADYEVGHRQVLQFEKALRVESTKSEWFITAAVLIQWWIAGSVRTNVLEKFGNIFLSDFFPAKLLNVLN